MESKDNILSFSDARNIRGQILISERTQAHIEELKWRLEEQLLPDEEYSRNDIIAMACEMAIIVLRTPV